jgi:hypothetical protein
MNACWLCNGPGLEKCSRCQKALYCGRECQKRDWKYHKSECPKGKYPGRIVTLGDVNEVIAAIKKKTLADPANKDQWIRRRDEIDLWGRRKPLKFAWPNACMVKESWLRGLGLFATRALHPGVAVTFYPAHLVWRLDSSQYWHCPDLSQELVDKVDDPTKRRELQRDYTVQMGEWCITGLPELQHPRLLGHMVNDGIPCDPFCNVTEEELLADHSLLSKLVIEYYVGVHERTNSRLECDERGVVTALVTRTPVLEGEEFLVAYGPRFWLRKAFGINKELEQLLQLLERTNINLYLETKKFRSWNG